MTLRANDKPNCLQTDPEIFFPTPFSKEERELYTLRDYNKVLVKKVLTALRLCNECPIQSKCLSYSFKSKETAVNGIYGGTLENERAAAIGHKILPSQERYFQSIRAEAIKVGLYPPKIVPPEGEIPSCLEKQISLSSVWE